jgi:hypothetical protein
MENVSFVKSDPANKVFFDLNPGKGQMVMQGRSFSDSGMLTKTLPVDVTPVLETNIKMFSKYSSKSNILFVKLRGILSQDRISQDRISQDQIAQDRNFFFTRSR